jgi:hypothetical protein
LLNTNLRDDAHAEADRGALVQSEEEAKEP